MKRKMTKIKKKENSWLAQDKLKQALFWRRKHSRKITFPKINDKFGKVKGKREVTQRTKSTIPQNQNTKKSQNPKQKKGIRRKLKRWEAAARERFIIKHLFYKFYIAIA